MDSPPLSFAVAAPPPPPPRLPPRVPILLVVAAAGGTLVAAVLGVLLFSDWAWRRLRLALGRRWVLVTGQWDVRVVVAAVTDDAGNADGYRITAERHKAKSWFDQVRWRPDRSAPGHGFPPASPEYSALRNGVRGESHDAVQVVVDEAAFGYPWAQDLGSPWSDAPDVTVAGQVSAGRRRPGNRGVGRWCRPSVVPAGGWSSLG